MVGGQQYYGDSIGHSEHHMCRYYISHAPGVVQHRRITLRTPIGRRGLGMGSRKT